MQRSWLLAGLAVCLASGCADGAIDGRDDETLAAAGSGGGSECIECVTQHETAADGGMSASESGATNAHDSSRDTATPTAEPGAHASQDAATDPPVTHAATLSVKGPNLYDTCGNRLVLRGFEQIIGKGIDVGGSWDALIDEIAKTGANAIRVLPDSNTTVAEIDAVLARVVSHGMVFNITVKRPGWYKEPELQAVLMKYEPWMMLDAFDEPVYDDRARWLSDVKAAIADVRAAGYRVPLNVIANHYGRDLPSVLDHGDEVFASDPLHNTVLGWQAYWGSDSGAQGSDYGMTVSEGVQAAAAKGFPVQIGIDRYTDPEIVPNLTLDYETVMQATESHELGWLWWDWYNPFGNKNNASLDGTASNLTDFGNAVVNSSPNAVRIVSKLACTP